jgi:hypothetical protein
MPISTRIPGTPTTRKGLRGRYFIGVIDGHTVCGKVEKQVHGPVYALRVWSWDRLKPQDLRVLDVSQGHVVSSFAFYNTVEGMKRAKARKVDVRGGTHRSLLKAAAKPA